MLSPSIILTLILIMTFTIEILFGFYILNLNRSAKINRLLFISFLLLAMTTISVTSLNIINTDSYYTVWQIIYYSSSIMLMSSILKTTLILTGKYNRYLKAIIYSTSIISSLIIISSEIIPGLFIGILKHVTYYSYLSVFILISTFLIVNYKIKSYDEKYVKRTNFLLTIFLSTTLVGYLLDSIIQLIYSSHTIYVGPIFHLIPMIGIAFLLRNNFNLLDRSERAKKELIISNHGREKMYMHFALLFITVGILNTLSYVFPNLISSNVIRNISAYSSLVLYVIGVIMFFLVFISSSKVKSFIVVTVAALAIPLVSIRFLHNSATTIWVFPIILMIASLVLTNKKMLVTIMASTVFSQLLVWKLAPSSLVEVNYLTFLGRLTILFVIFGVAVVVNHVYLNRLKENITNMEFQKIISDISFDFLNLNESKFDNNIEFLLKEAGEFFTVDRSYLFLVSENSGKIRFANEWVREEDYSLKLTNQEFEIHNDDSFIKKLLSESFIYVDNRKDNSRQFLQNKLAFLSSNIKSTLMIPIVENGDLIGFIGCDAINDTKVWDEKSIELLQTLANIIGSALLKIESEKVIKQMAYYDHLTKLQNRAFFISQGEKKLLEAQSLGRKSALIFIDLDDFKLINDTLGHSSGDQLLIEVAERLNKLVDKDTIISRFGGDEFLILFNKLIKDDEIISAAQRVTSLFEKPFFINDNYFYVACSAGVATFPEDGKTMETLIKNADIAMFEAKSNGKNQYVLCDNLLIKNNENISELSSAIFNAVENNELYIHYQPQVCTTTLKVVGFEALLRWIHPTFGFIPPNVFIPLAEKNGAIKQIGEWVFRESIKQNKIWLDNKLFKAKIAINLSISQFNDPKLVSNLKNIIDDVGIDPGYVELEVTESEIAKEDDYIFSELNKLKQLGLTISIDDFGTGQSSLSRLKMLLVDKLKIDMQFIKGIGNCKTDEEITKIIISLAKAVNLEVLAEGVETKEQLSILTDMKCDTIQGYYFYKPMTDIEITNNLVKHTS